MEPTTEDEEVTIPDGGPICGCNAERRLLYLIACSDADYETFKRIRRRVIWALVLDAMIEDDELL
jgi:hypothetical protein